MADAEGLVFEVQPRRFAVARVVRTGPLPAPADGQVLFRVDRFALTANNVSYAFTGKMLGYWRFFPTEDGWGRIPAMGFADVVGSRHPEVAVGERVFGFFPMATHLLIDAADVGPAQLEDGVAHRRDLAPAYRQYLRTGADPLYRAADEDALLLLRGLFLTAFLLDDFLDEHDGFGARQVIVSSASSKTSIALGHLLAARGRRRAVGLTSARNAAFVRELGCWDAVVEYGDVTRLDAAAPSVFVDVSGDGGLTAAVHGRLGDRLRHSAVVGATHWDAPRRSGALPGPAPEFFFAPGRIEKRVGEWGPAEFQRRQAAAWRRFAAWAAGWLRVVRGRGPTAVEQAYRAVLAGTADPRDGHVLSLWE